MYNSIFYLLYLAAKHGCKNIFGRNLSPEQIFLEKITGEKFPREKAEYLLMRISDLKWYIGEKLERDVGIKVAAIDFLENIAKTEQELKRFEDHGQQPNIFANRSSFA